MPKVSFGISKLHVGTYEVDATTGTVTMGTPYHQRGAVSFEPDEGESSNNFYADNIVYWGEMTMNAITGSVTVAKFDDEFKAAFLGYQATEDGGLALVKGAIKPRVYVAFEVETDETPIRVIYYNAAPGNISRSYNTVTESKTPDTESLSFNITGDENSGIVRATYKRGDSGYANLFTSPAAPALAGSSNT